MLRTLIECALLVALVCTLAAIFNTKGDVIKDEDGQAREAAQVIDPWMPAYRLDWRKV